MSKEETGEKIEALEVANEQDDFLPYVLSFQAIGLKLEVMAPTCHASKRPNYLIMVSKLPADGTIRTIHFPNREKTIEFLKEFISIHRMVGAQHIE